MVGLNRCDLTKKADFRETICTLERKINEIIEKTNRVIEENEKIKKENKEILLLFDYLMDEQGVKIPLGTDDSTIEVGTIFRNLEGELKYKKKSNEIKTIQLI